MPVVTMISRENAFENGVLRLNVREIADYFGHEKGIHHHKDCHHFGDNHSPWNQEFSTDCLTTETVDNPNRPPYKMTVKSNPLTGKPLRDENGNFIPANYSDTCTKFDSIFMETKFVGAVLDTGEYNGRDDSDFYAVVWDGEKVCRVQYASTRFWTYPNSASIDATDEVKALASAYLRRVALENFKANDEGRARAPAKDKILRVLSGKHKGNEGRCVGISERRSQYGTWSYGKRAGIVIDAGEPQSVYRVTTDDDGCISVKSPYDANFIGKARKIGGQWDRYRKLWIFPACRLEDVNSLCSSVFAPSSEKVIWVPVENCEVVGWEQYLTDDDTVNRYADSVRSNWRGMTAAPGSVLM